MIDSRRRPFTPIGFVAMPSDPAIPLTTEQMAALFPNPGAWRQVVDIVLAQDALKEATHELV